MTTTERTLAQVFHDGVVKAAALIIDQTDGFPKVKAAGCEINVKVYRALIDVIPEKYKETVEEMAAAQHMGEPMLREILNANCNLAAIAALKEVEATL